MTVGLDQFLQRLRSSGLPLPAEWEPPGGSRSFANAKELARMLVAKEVLTRYQAQVLLGYRQGPLVLENYVILSHLGEGGMGQVYRALHRHIRRTVAVKVLPSSSAARNEKSVRRFYREVRTLAQLQHPHIVTAHDAGEHEGTLFLVMEYVTGMDFAELVHRHGPLPLFLALRYLLQAAVGLQYAHRQGVVHRDIKPRNLLLELPECSEQQLKENNPRFHLQHQGSVKILDLGLALWRAESESAEAHLTQTGEVMGTVDYMSPEQSESTHDVDARSDIYSLGCTLFFLLTGRPPYQDKSPIRTILAHRSAPVPSLADAVRQTNPDWAVSLASAAEAEELLRMTDRLFRRSVAKKPEDRHETIDALIEQLQLLLARMENPRGPGGTRRIALPGRTQSFQEEAASSESPFPGGEPETGLSSGARSRGRRRSPWPAILVAGGVLLVFLLGIAWWLGQGHPPSGTLVLVFSSKADAAGAQVLLDGRKAGTVTSSRRPLRLKVPSRETPWQVVVAKPGYRRFSASVSVAPDQETRVRVQLSPLTPPRRTPPPTPASPDKSEGARKLALWVLQRHGSVTLLQGRQRLVVRSAEGLPREPFRVVGIRIAYHTSSLRPMCTDEKLAQVLPLMQDIRSLELTNTAVTDRTLQALARLPRLELLRLGQTDISSRGLTHLVSLKRLRRLSLLGTPITDQGLQQLGKISTLQELVLRQTPITDRGVAHLVQLKQLKQLDLGETAVSSAVGQWLKQIGSLEVIELDQVEVNDALFRDLAQLPRLKLLSLAATDTSDAHLELLLRIRWLRVLDVSATRITDAGLELLQRHPHLQEVAINRTPPGETPSVSDQGLARLVRIPNLWSLQLAHASLTDQGLRVLPQAEELRRLGLSGVKLRGSGLAFVANIPRLRRLDLSHNAALDPSSLVQLTAANYLIELNLNDTPTDDDSLKHVGAVKSLTRLSLARTKVTDAGLEHLAQLNELVFLDLRGTSVTVQGARRLRERLSRPCFVVVD